MAALISNDNGLDIPNEMAETIRVDKKQTHSKHKDT